MFGLLDLVVQSFELVLAVRFLFSFVFLLLFFNSSFDVSERFLGTLLDVFFFRLVTTFRAVLRISVFIGLVSFGGSHLLLLFLLLLLNSLLKKHLGVLLDSLGQLSLKMVEDLLLLVAFFEEVISDIFDELGESTLFVDDILHLVLDVFLNCVEAEMLFNLFLEIDEWQFDGRSLVKLHWLHVLEIKTLHRHVVVNIEQLLQVRVLLLLRLLQVSR